MRTDSGISSGHRGSGSLGVISFVLSAGLSCILIMGFLLSSCHLGADPSETQAILNIASGLGSLGGARIALAIRNSFLTASISALVSSVAGSALAFALHGSAYAMSKSLLAIMRIPFALPSVMIITAMASIFGVSGIFPSMSRLLYSRSGIILANAYYGLPFVFLSVSSSLSQRGYSREESFATLGAGRFMRFALITFPALFRTLALSFMLVFFSAFSGFAIVMTFGGLRFSSIETETYKAFMTGDWPICAVLRLLSLFFSFLFAFAIWVSQRNDGKTGGSMLRFTPREVSAPRKLTLDTLASLLCFVIVFPLLRVVFGAFMSKGAFSLSNFRRLSVSFPVIAKSAVFSMAVSILSVIIALIFAANSKRSGRANLVMLVSASLSGALLSTSLSSLPSLSLIVAHLILTAPFSYYMLKGEYDAMSPSVIECSRVLGGSDLLSVFCVELPNMRHAIANGISFSFALSFCDVTSTLILAKGKFYTASMLLYQAISRYDFALASAICVVIALCVAASHFLADLALRALYR